MRNFLLTSEVNFLCLSELGQNWVILVKQLIFCDQNFGVADKSGEVHEVEWLLWMFLGVRKLALAAHVGLAFAS